MRQTIIEINQNALRSNLQRVRTLAPTAKIVSMVKANAYGHGIEQCLAALQETDNFGVACLEEALEIRKLGYKQPICLMEGIFHADEMPLVLEHQLDCVVHQQQQLDWLLAHREQYQQLGLKVWVKLNSGMNRLGFKFSDIHHTLNLLIEQDFDCVIVMHFANADEVGHPLNQIQIQQFLALKQDYPQLEFSCCNSAAIFNWPELHFDYVRPGIMLYGSSPFAYQSAEALGLKAVMSFKTEIIALYPLKQGDAVGYGSTAIAMRDMVLAIIAVGYGDGYPRAYQQENGVLINGHYAPLFGRVSMDMSLVDVTDLINQGLDISLHTAVELWGQQLSVDQIAKNNGTIGYELLCQVTQRPHRKVV